MPPLLWLIGVVIGGAVAVFALRRFLRLPPSRQRQVGLLAAIIILLVIGLGLILSGNASGLLAVISAGMVWLGRAQSLYGLYHRWFGRNPEAGDGSGSENDRTARQQRSNAPPSPGSMTRDEAFQVLGLPPTATLDEIRRAHRALMRVNHPDQGGSVWLAARINQARDLLLNGR